MSNIKHGMYTTVEYIAWKNMKKRCYDKNYGAYKNYGNRGITVCERWLHSFSNFYADMGDRPEGYSLDRINNNGNYEPTNCRWADKLTQSTNKRPSLVGRSGVRGVRRTDRKNPWSAHINFNKRYIHLGSYPTLTAATKARKKAEVVYFGSELK